MKYMTFVLLVLLLVVMVSAQGNQMDTNKKKATYVEQGSDVSSGSSKDNVEINASGLIKVQQNGDQTGRKSKEKVSMGSASSSGPAVKIRKINAKPTVSIQEVARSLDNDGETKKRSK